MASTGLTTTESEPARGNIMTKYRRASRFTEQIGERICDLLYQGHSVLGIARMRGMPPGTTIRRGGWNARLTGI
jgi:hypothetical protein